MKMNLDFSGFEKQINKAIVSIENANINNLMQVGLKFVRNARMNDTYKDQTGNLRSSIGFIIMHNGKIVKEDFELSPTGTDKGAGMQKGKEYASRLSLENPSNYVLICVAGMEYAGYVEIMGYDVITGSSLQAKQDLKKYFR